VKRSGRFLVESSRPRWHWKRFVVSGRNEIGREFGVHPTQVGLWKKELLEQASHLFDAKRGPKPADPSASPERLYSEIGRLKMELDWLKKKSGISP